MIDRACSALAATRSRDTLRGKVPRIHRLPSSNSGMNSRPSRGSRQMVPAISVPITRMVTQRYFRHTRSCHR